MHNIIICTRELEDDCKLKQHAIVEMTDIIPKIGEFIDFNGKDYEIVEVRYRYEHLSSIAVRRIHVVVVLG